MLLTLIQNKKEKVDKMIKEIISQRIDIRHTYLHSENILVCQYKFSMFKYVEHIGIFCKINNNSGF